MRRRSILVLLVSVLTALFGGAGLPTTLVNSAATATLTVNRAARAGLAAVRVSPPQRVPATLPAGSSSCPKVGHGAVVDRAHQRGWLCTDGGAAAAFPITTAISMPNPGTYHVYAKDRLTTSTFGGHFSYLDNFVAFTYGPNTGARVAFHAVPRDSAGNPYQPYDTVGSAAWFGQSSGCIRVLPGQSQMIWDHLGIGDAVIVIS